jgi:hypothetical protein
LASFEYPQLKERTVLVQVLDNRAEREDSAELSAATKAAITKSLTAAGVRVAATAPVTIDVRITRYRADFELGQWNGCTTLTLDLVAEGQRVSANPFESCVRGANTAGYGSANAVLVKSWKDALSSMLSDLGRRAAVPSEDSASRPGDVQL